MKPFASTPFVYASMIASVPDVLADHGGKVDRPFSEVGVPIELASQPELIIPIHDYLNLLASGARETGDEHFGVSMAERMKIEDLGPFGRLISGAPTLRRAIETTNALVHKFSPAMKCWLELEGDTARWSYQLNGVRNGGEGYRLDCEASLVLFRTVVRLATSSGWQPSEILLGQTTRRNLRSFQSRFGGSTRYAETAYALDFPRALLDLPMIYAQPLGELQQQALLTRLNSTRPEDSFVGFVKAVIRSQLCGGYPEISAVARATEMTVRTFQRRLAEAGLVFSNLVADVRRDLAQEMLADPWKKQLDISLSLGYSDAANFSRAFKQWTGITPREFRRSLALLTTTA